MLSIRARLSALIGLTVAVAFLTAAARSQAQAPAAAPTVIKVTAKKYDFVPEVITVVQGKPVRLEITATDRDHGLEIKDLKLKVDLKKAVMTKLEFTPDKAGEFEIKCSTFCGLGHHGMKGKLVVTAK